MVIIYQTTPYEVLYQGEWPYPYPPSGTLVFDEKFYRVFDVGYSYKADVDTWIMRVAVKALY